MTDTALRDLASRAGISVAWRDASGHSRVVAPDVLRRILAALDLPANTSGDVTASRRKLVRRSTLADLSPLVTAVAGRPTRLEVSAAEAKRATLILEQGKRHEVSLMPTRGRLRIPAIAEIGYHRLRIEDREIVIAVAPPQCRTIDDVVPDARLWGLAAQAYALRRPGDGGIGDAAAIVCLAEDAAARGADALALSPLNALFTADPWRFAPYSPSSRLFLNPLYAAPALVFGSERIAQAIRDSGLTDQLSRLEARALIDWPASADAKLFLLRSLFDTFVSGSDGEDGLSGDFALFRADGGDDLRQHAEFEALSAYCMPERDWHRWPVDLQNPRTSAVTAFAAAHQRDVLFHAFLQWVTDRSMRAAQRRTREAGMRIGLIGDLPVGIAPAGSQAWSRPNDLLPGVSIGAPPDLFNPRGQDWGLTGLSPRALQQSGFDSFIATLRSVLRYAGGVRMDHAMALCRLWLLPQGAEPSDGAYLAYPFTDLLRILALESVRHRAIVIGEDLGTVPDGFRDTLRRTGIHGIRVLWFERDNSQRFVASDAWDSSAVATTSTHDLPTVAGWWMGADIAARAACGRLGAGESREEAEAARNADRLALWQRFETEGAANGQAPPPDAPEEVVDAAVRFVGRVHAPLCLLPVEDLFAQEAQVNLPGTVEEYPNWRLRLPGPATSPLRDRPAARAAILAAERPRE